MGLVGRRCDLLGQRIFSRGECLWDCWRHWGGNVDVVGSQGLRVVFSENTTFFEYSGANVAVLLRQAARSE